MEKENKDTLPKKKIKAWKIILIVVLVIVLIAVAVAGAAFLKARSIIKNSTDSKTETVHMCVYVDKDDPAENIEQAADYSFGILTSIDREYTDKAVEEIQERISKAPETKEYGSVVELADAMSSGEIQALIVNEAILGALSDDDEYSEFESSLKVIYDFNYEYETVDGTAGVTADSFIMYISGIDTWGGVGLRSRSDVNILAVVNTKTHKVLLVSTPRDYYVPLSISNGVRDKLTHAGIYGIQCSVDTLEELYGVNIDYYFRLNFSGFEAIIDALGGVTVQSDYDFTVRSKHYVKGSNFLNGSEALAFARERHSLPGGDNARGHNQMSVITGVINKLSSSAMLKNYNQVLNSIDGMFETSMPYDEVEALIRSQLTSVAGWAVESYAVTGTGASNSTFSMGSRNLYVMIPNQASVDEAKAKIAAVLNGD